MSFSEEAGIRAAGREGGGFEPRDYRRRLSDHLSTPGATPARGDLLTRTLAPRDLPTSGDEDVADVFPTMASIAAICPSEDVGSRLLSRLAAAELEQGGRLPILVAAPSADAARTRQLPFVAVADLEAALDQGEELLILVQAFDGESVAREVVDLRSGHPETAVCVACDRAGALALRDLGFRAMPVTPVGDEDRQPQPFPASTSAEPRRPELVAAVGVAPVTVSEFAPFIEDGGYLDPRWWVGFEEEMGRWPHPRDWSEQIASPTHPVTGVSWYEATAFAAYRAQASGEPLALTSLAARRGVCAEPYPWGVEAPSPSLLNFDQYVGRTSPVDTYVRGRGPMGHSDLAGNVWEWCSDRVGSESAAVCGGGWYTSAAYVSSTYHYQFHRGNRFNDLGFRLALREGSHGYLHV